ncbi:hypothetical protein [Amycolatopsis sp. cg9]|uniref:hypothetical protein n=1 Tax=Amycolatopsis sp. cg9 TaxID=3238801 RepID=UPI003523C0D3
MSRLLCGGLVRPSVVLIEPAGARVRGDDPATKPVAPVVAPGRIRTRRASDRRKS